MANIHLIGGEKGGVGKSLVARVLAQYFIDHSIAFLGFDSDRSHGALLRFYAGYASPVLIDHYESLDAIVDQVVPGRSATLRPHARKELAATRVLALPLLEASVKARTGGPVDDEPDVEAGGWAGVVPVRTVFGEPVTAADVDGATVPDHVLRRVSS